MKYGRALVLALFLLLAAGIVFFVNRLPRSSESMFINSSDKVKVAYDWYSAEKPLGYLLLVHMMPVTKESWKNFAKEMQKLNYASIAIDLRGHGQSDGGPNGYQKFSDAEHQKSILDLEAAIDFLKKQGAAPERITLIGASIGANLSLRYITEHPEVKSAVLLSAGLNYRGIVTKPLVKKLSAGQKILFFASEDDDGNAAMNQELFELVPAGVKKELVVYKKGGHGTNFLSQAIPKIQIFLK